MLNNSYGKLIGARFKRAYTVRGYSAEQIAEKLVINADEVVTLVENGIHDTTLLMKINELLEVDLLDETDLDIDVLQMKIMEVVFKRQGYIEYENLLKRTKEIDGNEEDIQSLIDRGMLINEQFVDRNEKHRNGVFVTNLGKIWGSINTQEAFAKGVHLFGADVSNTYESLCAGFTTYQEYVNHMREKEIKELNEYLWCKEIVDLLDQTMKIEQPKDKMYQYTMVKMQTSIKMDEYKFTVPNVIVYGIYDIMSQVDCNDEHSFENDLEKAVRIIKVIFALTSKDRRNPVYE